MATINTHKIVQLGILLIVTLIPAKSEGACPDLWVEFENRCYLFVEDRDISWQDADRTCREMSVIRATLASIHSQAENQFIYENAAAVVGDHLWIGLHGTDEGSYKWTDESEVNFVAWDIGAPTGKECVHMQRANGYWSDVDCNPTEGSHGFVCAGRLETQENPILSLFNKLLFRESHHHPPANPVVEEIPEHKQNCPGGEWMGYNGRCFLFKVEQSRDHKTWDDAMSACNGFNGGRASLVSIHSQKENDFILENARSKMNGGRMHVWIGMKKNGPGYPYVWQDGSAVDYINWDDGEPNDVDGSQPCCRLFEHNGMWDDFDCTGRQEWEEYHGYICQAEPAQTSNAACQSVPDAPYKGCCAAGDVFAIIFGLIILAAIVIGILGYLYLYRWDRKLPWQKTTAAPSSFENPDYAKSVQ